MQKRNCPNRKSIRLKGWDYRTGLYFITICTDESQHHFGHINDGMMGLSVPGCIAWHYWRQIPHHQENVILDEFVVMPDHIHGIIGIESEEAVGTCHGMSVPNASEAERKAKFGQPQSKSLSMIINHFKGAVTRWCNAHEYEYFAWQSRFYDHIIRNERALKRIRQYIFDNPLQWQKGKRDRNTDSNIIHEQAVEYMAVA
ncbi:transposase [Aliifodinibius salicampi]|uniref:Transposase n=1 Tax=Fodinibius salicampi TaxID=1920655 RepID=A0ABT3PX70_9BACT|nr:transposase [Fodinibius salicampi]MCW9712447.1 transposase [Fodinibius salicampi]